MVATRTQPSPEEIQAYIRQVAARYGINPNTFLQVVKGESGFNPAAVGDSGHSQGIAQLYDKGLAPEFQQKTGLDPGDPSSWRQAIDFMGEKVAKGGQGWTPWHAAANQGISQFAGLGGQPGTATGRQGLTGVAAAAPASGVSTQPQAAFGMSDLEMLRKMWEPKPTVASSIVDALIPGRKDLPYDQKSHSLLGLGISGIKDLFQSPDEMAKEKAASDLTAKYNPASPISAKAQLAQAQKQTLGTTIANYAGLTSPKPAMTPQQMALLKLQPQQRTLSQGLFGMFKPGGFFG
jgi:hypothetical protein